MATLVKFYKEENSVMAFFPQLKYHKRNFNDKIKMSYTHIGQHSGCNVDYAKNLRPSTNFDECLDLIGELNNIGYELKILNKFIM